MKWEKVKLGEVSRVSSSKRIFARQYVRKGVPFYRQKEIIDKKNKNFIIDPLFISVETYNEIKKKFGVPVKGDLLITAVGASLGIPYIVDDEIFYFKDGNLIWLSNFNENINSKYIYYWITSDIGQKMMWSRVIGSAQPALTIDIIKQFELSIPTYILQNKIVKILETYDKLIENNQKQIKLLEEAAQRLYKEWFVNLRFPGYENTPIIDGVPKGWKKEDLINLVDIQYGYAFKGSLFNNIGKGMPIIRIRNIPDGQTTDFTTEKVSKEYIIHNGDILVGMDGEFYVNSWGGEDAYLVQRTCCLRPKFNNMKGYLLQAILEPIKFFEKTVVGATVTHLGKKHINTIKIFSVPNVLYEPFQMWYEKRQSLVNQNRLLTEARNRLISQIMGRKFII